MASSQLYPATRSSLLLLLLDRYHLTHISLLLMTSTAAVNTHVGKISPGCQFFTSKCLTASHVARLLQSSTVPTFLLWKLSGVAARPRTQTVWELLSESSLQECGPPTSGPLLKTQPRLTLIPQICWQTTQAAAQDLQHQQQMFPAAAHERDGRSGLHHQPFSLLLAF